MQTGLHRLAVEGNRASKYQMPIDKSVNEAFLYSYQANNLINTKNIFNQIY